MLKEHKQNLNNQYFWIKNKHLKYELFLLSVLVAVLLQQMRGIFVK